MKNLVLTSSFGKLAKSVNAESGMETVRIALKPDYQCQYQLYDSLQHLIQLIVDQGYNLGVNSSPDLKPNRIVRPWKKI